MREGTLSTRKKDGQRLEKRLLYSIYLLLYEHIEHVWSYDVSLLSPHAPGCFCTPPRNEPVECDDCFLLEESAQTKILVYK